MKEYHYNWIKAHPGRDEEWLGQVIEQGFDIHHLDGNHQNNEADNLLLVEHQDHMRILHKGGRLRIASGGEKGPGNPESVRKWTKRFESKGGVAYELRLTGLTWAKVLASMDDVEWGNSAGVKVVNLAKSFALTHGLKWPLVRDLKSGKIL